VDQWPGGRDPRTRRIPAAGQPVRLIIGHRILSTILDLVQDLVYNRLRR
jgi:hypothetical protein